MEEKIKVLSIDTSLAQKSVGDLRKELQECRIALESTKVGTDENRKAAEELSKVQNTLNAALKGAIDDGGKLSTTYNGLSSQMAMLKAEQKNLNISTEEGKKKWIEYSTQINAINDKLKGLDATNGVFSRNVGDYANQFSAGLSSMGVSCGALTKGLGLVNGAMKTLAANPLMAVIAATVVLLKKFADSLKNNEKAMNSLSKSLAPFKGLLNELDNVLGIVGNGFAWLVDKIMIAVNAIAGFYDKAYRTVADILDFFGADWAANTINKTLDSLEKYANAAEDIVNREIELQQLRRKNIIENSELELEASKARADANDKENKSAEERLAAIKKYNEIQLQLVANKQNEAEKELELLELQAAQSENSKEDNDRLAEAKAKVNKAQIEYLSKLKETNAQEHSIQESIRKEAEERAKAVADWKKGVEDAQKTLLHLNDSDRSYYENQLILLEENEKKQLETIKEYRKKGYITKAEYLNAEKQIHSNTQKAIVEIEEQKNAEIQANKEAYDKLFLIGLDKQISEISKRYDDEVNKQKEALDKKIINEEEYNKRVNALRDKEKKEVSDANELSNLQLSKESTRQAIFYLDLEHQKRLENNAIDLEYTIAYYNTRKELMIGDLQSVIDSNATTVEDKRAAAEKIQEIELETYAAIKNAREKDLQDFEESLESIATVLEQSLSNMFNASDFGIEDGWLSVINTLDTAMIKLSKSIKSGSKDWKGYADVAAIALQGVSQTLTTLSEQQDTSTEEGFEKQKQLQIASTVMSMLSGIVFAMSNSIRDLGIPAGAIVGAAMSAMIAGLGGAQIAQIKKTQMDGSSSSSSNVGLNTSAINAAATPVAYENIIETAKMEESITNQRVYVLESDISNAQKRVKVQESESIY